MDANPRSCIAYVAGTLISGKEASFIYDHAHGKYLSVSGIVTDGFVKVYDYERACHLYGPGRHARFDLRYGGNQHRISLSLMGQEFMGFDHPTGAHFQGRVQANAILIYDFALGDHFNYTL